MRHVAPPLAELTAQAQTLTSAGDLEAARAVLDDALDPADADPQRASADLALAAALHARILIALGDTHAARTWAGFAHAAEERLHGPHDERTLAAAAIHAAVLQRVGNHGRAAQLYHDLVGELTALDGPSSQRVLAAEADLATAEHAAGQCTAARVRLETAWERHREAYGDGSAAGIKMLARLGAMERECGRDAAASGHLAQAQELCARYLPPDHPLAQQVARLAGTPASGRHACGQVRRSDGPDPDSPASHHPATHHPATHHPASHSVANQNSGAASPEAASPEATGPGAGGPEATGPGAGGPGAGGPAAAGPAAGGPAPGVTRVPATTPGVYPVPRGPEAPGDLTGRHARPEPPIALPLDPPAHPPIPAQATPSRAHPEWTASTPPIPGVADTNQPGAGWPISAPPLPDEPNPGRPTLGGQAGSAWPAPSRADPDDWEEEQEIPAGAVPAYQASSYSGLSQPVQPPADLHGPPPPVQPLPPQEWSVQPPGPFPPDSVPPVAYPADEYPPGPQMPRQPRNRATAAVPDRRLPVPVAEGERGTSRQPFILAAAVVAGIAIAAAIVAVTLPDGDGNGDEPGKAAAPAPTSAQPSPSPPEPSPTGTAVAPAGVKLQDNRDSVALTWRYPKGSEGPVLISGGRVGQERRAFQQLPAGTTDYVVYGLNEQNDYCFTVAVVYTVDQVAASKAVCTDRK
jgi:hypothetical protein